ncbi:hypothetical protein, partial [Marinobacter persicus]|uniref:hypothetical protein n=1 Tax=Marinobacter persicus TaxID=930118 RepID=UPI001CA5E1B1
RWRSLWISSSEHRMHRQVFINPAVALGVGDRPVCTTDNLVVSFYTAQKRSPDAKTLDEIKRVVEGMVRDWYKEDVEVLKIAEKRAHQ